MVNSQEYKKELLFSTQNLISSIGNRSEKMLQKAKPSYTHHTT